MPASSAAERHGYRFTLSHLGWILLAFAPVTGSVLFAPVALAQSHSHLTAQAVSPLQERVLRVTGEGRQSIPTTLSQVNLGVVVEANTAEAAQQQAAQRQTAVIEWLRSQNVEQLETTGISLNPRYDYVRDRQVLRNED